MQSAVLMSLFEFVQSLQTGLTIVVLMAALVLAYKCYYFMQFSHKAVRDVGDSSLRLADSASKAVDGVVGSSAKVADSAEKLADSASRASNYVGGAVDICHSVVTSYGYTVVIMGIIALVRSIYKKLSNPPKIDAEKCTKEEYERFVVEKESFVLKESNIYTIFDGLILTALVPMLFTHGVGGAIKVWSFLKNISRMVRDASSVVALYGKFMWDEDERDKSRSVLVDDVADAIEELVDRTELKKQALEAAYESKEEEEKLQADLSPARKQLRDSFISAGFQRVPAGEPTVPRFTDHCVMCKKHKDDHILTLCKGNFRNPDYGPLAALRGLWTTVDDQKTIKNLESHMKNNRWLVPVVLFVLFAFLLTLARWYAKYKHQLKMDQRKSVVEPEGDKKFYFHRYNKRKTVVRRPWINYKTSDKGLINMLRKFENADEMPDYLDVDNDGKLMYVDELGRKSYFGPRSDGDDYKPAPSAGGLMKESVLQPTALPPQPVSISLKEQQDKVNIAALLKESRLSRGEREAKKAATRRNGCSHCAKLRKDGDTKVAPWSHTDDKCFYLHKELFKSYEDYKKLKNKRKQPDEKEGIMSWIFDKVCPMGISPPDALNPANGDTKMVTYYRGKTYDVVIAPRQQILDKMAKLRTYYASQADFDQAFGIVDLTSSSLSEKKEALINGPQFYCGNAGDSMGWATTVAGGFTSQLGCTIQWDRIYVSQHIFKYAVDDECEVLFHTHVPQTFLDTAGFNNNNPIKEYRFKKKDGKLVGNDSMMFSLNGHGVSGAHVNMKTDKCKVGERVMLCVYKDFNDFKAKRLTTSIGVVKNLIVKPGAEQAFVTYDSVNGNCAFPVINASGKLVGWHNARCGNENVFIPVTTQLCDLATGSARSF